MKELFEGAIKFQEEDYVAHQELYESLKRQTVKDFEWLVVDDGSTDNTSELLAEWTKENDFPVRYIWQPNGGKPRAITKALAEAKGEWFFIVDSDDFISDDAIETIIRYAPECTGKTGIIVFPMINYTSGKILGKPYPAYKFICNQLEFDFKYRLIADKAEIIRTEILRQYPFPEFDDEKFVPEAIVSYRMSDKVDMLCIYKPIYYCEYLSDGYTKGFCQNLRNNPKGFALYYKENAMRRGIPVIYRLKFWIRYIQCTIYAFVK